MKFTVIASARAAIDEVLAPTRVRMERESGGAALAYIEAIARRDFETWRRLEQPFMEAGSGPIAVFRAQCGRWIEGVPEIDPAGVQWQISATTLDPCELKATLALSRTDRTQPVASLAICWHAEHTRWYPCRPLTRASTNGIVRP